MTKNRLLYLAVLALCLIFYIAYGQWLSFLILTGICLLPWFSLALSLPAICRFRAVPTGPELLDMGAAGELWLLGSCGFPMPPFRGKLKLRRCTTGEQWFYQEPKDLLTDHCGGLAVTAEGVRVCDYLGLFAFPVRCREQLTIRVRPRPVEPEPGQAPPRMENGIWQPKSGGGCAELHELRPYRPGDRLNQIHWKLSAKAGSLILREPLEPRQGLLAVTLNHRGTHEELDRKLGRLLHLGTQLVGQELPFVLRALTGDGLVSFFIAGEQELTNALDALLCSRTARDGDVRTGEIPAVWHCHIGGAPDEP